MKKVFSTIAYVIALTAATLLSGCGQTTEAEVEQPEQIITNYNYAEGSYDSEDFAVVTAVDTQLNTISFRNAAVHKQYTLSVSDTSVINNKYGSPMYITAVRPGDVVRVRFLKDIKVVTEITYPVDIWVDSDVTNFFIDESGTGMTIGKDKYDFAEDLLIFYAGEQISLADIDACDVLEVHGNEHTIYSIVVTTGHGYLRLAGDAYFVGGWIEIGNNIIRRISDGMSIAVPEGDYTVRLSNNGNIGEKEVTIEAGREVTLDLSDIKIEETHSGTITFNILPENAEPVIAVDNITVEGTSVTLEYGVHQLLLMAEGYEAAVMYLKVGSPSYEFSYTMTAKETEEEDSETTESTTETSTETSSETTTGTTTETSTGTESGSSASSDTETAAYVLITEPVDVEVYVDGSYVGISPVLFKKVAGSHVITLRRTGYQTRSYTITLDDSDDDEEYTFTDLLSLE